MTTDDTLTPAPADASAPPTPTTPPTPKETMEVEVLVVDEPDLPTPADAPVQTPEGDEEETITEPAQAAQESEPAIEPVEVKSEEEPAALESDDESEAVQAEVIDTEFAQLLTTPAGLRGALEALLFVSPDPLPLARICRVLEVNDSKVVAAMLTQLRNDYDAERRGIQIVETASGYQMATRDQFGDLILRLKNRKRRPSLSPASLETLAIIAYRQPIIRAEIEAVRGVESGGTIRNLIDMNLVEMVGRKEVLGRPPMYGTTETFLHAFGLRALTDLPAIGELKRRFMEQAKADEEAEIEQRTATPAPQPEVPDEPAAEPEPEPASSESANPEMAIMEGGADDLPATETPAAADEEEVLPTEASAPGQDPEAENEEFTDSDEDEDDFADEDEDEDDVDGDDEDEDEDDEDEDFDDEDEDEDGDEDDDELSEDEEFDEDEDDEDGEDDEDEDDEDEEDFDDEDEDEDEDELSEDEDEDDEDDEDLGNEDESAESDEDKQDPDKDGDKA